MEEQITIKIAVNSEVNNQKNGVSEAWSQPVENQTGHVFCLVEIKGWGIVSEIIKETIKNHLCLLAATQQEKISVSHCFEQTLSAINEDIATKSKDFEMPPVENFHALIGVAINQTMYLSGTGEMTALFFNKKSDQKYQIFNLSRNIETEQNLKSWQKLFTVVLDGDLRSDDIFCASNIPLQQEISPEDLNNLLTTLPPQGAVVKLRQYFSLETSLSLFIMKIENLNKQKATFSAPASLRQLHASREQTKQILADQKPMFLKNFWGKNLSAIIQNKNLRRFFILLFRLLISSLRLLAIIIVDFIKWLFSLIKRLISSERKLVIQEIRRQANQIFFFILRRFKLLPKISRYLMLIALALIIILALGIFLISRGRQAAEERIAFEQTFAKSESMFNDASSAIIYKNEDRAKTIVQEAQNLLATLKTTQPNEEKKVQELQASLTKLANELRRTTETTPEILASASTLPSPIELATLALFNNEIYTLGSDHVVYKVNQSTKNLETVSLNESVGTAQEASTDNQTIIWLDNRPGLDIFDVAEKKLTITNTKPADNEKWTDLYVYADRVYVLSPGSGLTSQIYKISRSGNEFSSVTNWLKSPTDELATAQALAVDGTVFVLNSHGKILRFVSGRDVAWTQAVVEPTLTSASDIWTSAESDFLYVLDPAGQRVIVYEKESGNLKTQYHGASFSNLTDFAIDETNKNIYLLGGGNIYKIEAEHLK